MLTSTSPGELAYFTGQGLLSFSQFFWAGVLNGDSIGQSFAASQAGIADTPTSQTPLLDANGNGTPNEPADFAAVQNAFIGSGTANFLSGPSIGSVTATISAGSTGTVSANNVMDVDGVNRVWAVLYAPDFQAPTSDNPVTDLPALELLESPPGSGDYAAEYSGFTTPGTYQVVVSASDRLGNTSVPKVTTVTVSNPLARRAVIVAGGKVSDPDWPGQEAAATAAYHALKSQGYADTNIRFLSATTVNGVEELATLSNLQYALTTWAAADSQDVVLYLAGESDGSIFTMGATDLLPADQLDAWLDSLQSSLPGKLAVIMDADNAGFYLARLTSPAGEEESRIRLASTHCWHGPFRGRRQHFLLQVLLPATWPTGPRCRLPTCLPNGRCRRPPVISSRRGWTPTVTIPRTSTTSAGS